MIKIEVLLGLLSVLLGGSALAERAAAPACPIAAQLEGDAALTTAIAQALRSQGIATVPPAGCPQTFIRVAPAPRGLVVSIHQELAATERVVSDPAVAAALIESWMRSDLTDPLLVASELLAPPAPPLPPPRVLPPRPGTRFTVGLLFEAGIDKDAASWLGGSFYGCAPVGPICLGALVRGATNFPAIGVGTYLDERLAVDVLECAMNGKLLRFTPAGAADKDSVDSEPPGGRGLSAEALVVACGTGDSAALGELFDRYHQTVYRFLSRYLGPRNPDLDDLVQATFLEVRRAAPRFRKESSVNSWIVGIAVNVARHYLRSETRRRALLRNSELRPTCADGTPESKTAHSEFLQRLQQSILDLPEHLRAAFVMCELEGVPEPRPRGFSASVRARCGAAFTMPVS